VRPALRAQVHQQRVLLAHVQVLLAHVQAVLVVLAAQAVQLQGAVPAASHRAQQAQAGPQAHVLALVAVRQVVAQPLLVAAQLPVAAVVVEALQVPSAVKAEGQRVDGSPSGPSGPSTSSSRRHPLAACRSLAATATRRCACVAVRR